MLTVTLGLGTGKLLIISVYAPETNKSKEETVPFYEQLEEEVHTKPVRKLIIMGVLYA